MLEKKLTPYTWFCLSNILPAVFHRNIRKSAQKIIPPPPAKNLLKCYYPPPILLNVSTALRTNFPPPANYDLILSLKAHEMMTTTWEKTIVFNLISNVKMYLSSIMMYYWTTNTNKELYIFLPSKMVIHKQEVKLFLFLVWHWSVPLLANKKSYYHDYYSFKVNMCETYLLVIGTYR